MAVNIAPGHIPALAGAFIFVLILFLGGVIFLNKLSHAHK